MCNKISKVRNLCVWRKEFLTFNILLHNKAVYVRQPNNKFWSKLGLQYMRIMFLSIYYLLTIDEFCVIKWISPVLSRSNYILRTNFHYPLFKFIIVKTGFEKKNQTKLRQSVFMFLKATYLFPLNIRLYYVS